MEFVGKEEDRIKWAMHFAQVKANIVQPQRSHKVTVSGKSKAGKPYSYEYKYADLADVDAAVMNAIKKVVDDKGIIQFSYMFEVESTQEGVTVQTLLIDASGFYAITNKIWFKNANAWDAQATASLISYAKRYSLSAAFGVASEDDNDAGDQKTFTQPKVLTKKQLEEYSVTYQGFSANLMDLYQEALDGVEDAKNWIKSPHTPQDAQAIHQINEMHKREKARKADIKATQEKEKAEQEAQSKQAALEKIQQAKKDPFADKKVTSANDPEVDKLF